MKYECPSCHSENIQKLSIVYESGISDINTTSKGTAVGIGSGGLGIGVGAKETKGTSQTAASQRAAPPLKMKYLKPIGFILVLFIIVSIFIDTHSNIIKSILSYGFMASSIAWIYYAFQYNKKTWPPLKITWDRSFLCNRCSKQFTLEDEQQSKA